MSEVDQKELSKKSQELLKGTLKHVRVAALAAALMPLGAIAVSPLALQAQSSGPPTPLPEPTSIVLLGTGLTGLALAKLRKKK